MQTLTLAVLPPFRAEYGEAVTASPVELLALARRGVVNLSEPPLATRSLEAPQPRPRRRYRRRDLTADV